MLSIPVNIVKAATILESLEIQTLSRDSIKFSPEVVEKVQRLFKSLSSWAVANRLIRKGEKMICYQWSQIRMLKQSQYVPLTAELKCPLCDFLDSRDLELGC